MPTRDGAWRDSIGSGAARRSAIANALAASVSLAFAVGLFLLIRRMNGAFSAPLPVPQLAATAVTLAACSLCVRTLGSPIAMWLSTLSLILFALACSFPGDRFVDWLVWVPAIAISAVGLRKFGTGPAKRGRPASMTLVEAPLVSSPRGKVVEENDHESAQPTTDEREQLLQQITRFRTLDGCEVIQATLIAEFPPGERHATLYVAFCPPLERLPEVEASAVDGPDADVKVVQLLHNGAQLEVRMNEPSAAFERVAVELLAQSVWSAPIHSP